MYFCFFFNNIFLVNFNFRLSFLGFRILFFVKYFNFIIDLGCFLWILMNFLYFLYLWNVILLLERNYLRYYCYSIFGARSPFNFIDHLSLGRNYLQYYCYFIFGTRTSFNFIDLLPLGHDYSSILLFFIFRTRLYIDLINLCLWNIIYPLILLFFIFGI